MTKLTDAELKAAEAVLAKKYRGIVRGSLTNVASKGRFRNKRTIKVVCPHCKGKPILTSTQELFHLVCDHCGRPTQKWAK
jgi:DnaJ-class molecular chaperone